MSPEFRTPSIDTTTETEYVSWSSPAASLWVAATPSAYVGMVDRNHDGFVATGHMGHDLGVHTTMEAARMAVYTAWAASETAHDADAMVDSIHALDDASAPEWVPAA